MVEPQKAQLPKKPKTIHSLNQMPRTAETSQEKFQLSLQVRGAPPTHTPIPISSLPLLLP